MSDSADVLDGVGLFFGKHGSEARDKHGISDDDQVITRLRRPTTSRNGCFDNETAFPDAENRTKHRVCLPSTGNSNSQNISLQCRCVCPVLEKPTKPTRLPWSCLCPLLVTAGP